MTKKDFESSFGIEIPTAVIARAGTGMPSSLKFDVSASYRLFNEEYGFTGDLSITISSLLFLETISNYASMAANLQRLRTFRDLPKSLLPIAKCGNGDVIVCNIEIEICGGGDSVYLWVNESGETMPIAKDADVFYGGLVPDQSA